MDDRTSLAVLVGSMVSASVALTVGAAKKPIWVIAAGIGTMASVWLVDWITEVLNGAQSGETEDAEAARARILEGAAQSMGAGHGADE